MSSPLISIITVTYNAGFTIRPTMASVASQDFTDFEHIIIDGASTDDTVKIANLNATEHTHIVSKPDKGIYDAMNSGMEMARGSYYIFLNAGDSFHATNTLSLIAHAIAENNNPGIVYGQTILVGGPDRHVTGERHLKAPHQLSLKDFANGMVVCHQAMVVNKSIVGPYNLKYKLSADYDWAIRCLQRSRHNVYIDAILIDYLDEGMTTRHLRKSLMERFKIMCHYYGTTATIARHFKFALRGFTRRLTTQSKQ